MLVEEDFLVEEMVVEVTDKVEVEVVSLDFLKDQLLSVMQ